MTDSAASNRPWLLALDTSTDWAGIALTDGEALAELNWSAGRRQTTQVMPETQRLLGAMGVGVESLGAIAVASGPGSFSGLRVGMAIASGISVASGIPVIGVSTLLQTVHGWTGSARPVVGVIRAGRSRYGWAIDADIERPATGSVSELVEVVRQIEAAIVVGELIDEDAIRLRELTGALIPPIPDRQRRAGTLARIGWERWKSGEFNPAAPLDPVYLHRH